jgi:acyl dehydratase
MNPKSADIIVLGEHPRAADTLTLDELAEGMTASVPFLILQEEMDRFAELSGDFNPLHVNDEFARGKGFKGAVVYGALIIAKVSQLVGMRLPGRDAVWASVSLDFIRPLYVNEQAQVEGVVTEVWESTGMVKLKLVVRSAAGKVLSKGTAEVLLVRK